MMELAFVIKGTRLERDSCQSYFDMRQSIKELGLVARDNHNIGTLRGELMCHCKSHTAGAAGHYNRLSRSVKMLHEEVLSPHPAADLKGSLRWHSCCICFRSVFLARN